MSVTVILHANKTNSNLPNLDISTIEYAESRVAETIIPKMTAANPGTPANPAIINQALQGIDQRVEIDVSVNTLKVWLRENYELDPNQYVKREDVQMHYLIEAGYNRTNVVNMLSFCCKLGIAVNAEFNFKFSKKVPPQRKGMCLRAIYRGIRRR